MIFKLDVEVWPDPTSSGVLRRRDPHHRVRDGACGGHAHPAHLARGGVYVRAGPWVTAATGQARGAALRG